MSNVSDFQLSQSSTSTITSSSDDSPGFVFIEPEVRETVSMPFKRVSRTNKYCFICGPDVSNNLKVLSLEARIQCFVKTRVFIPKMNRCCREHLIKNRLYEDQYEKLRVTSATSEIDIDELTKFVDHLCVTADSTILDHVSDFSMPEEKLKVFMGLFWDFVEYLRQI